MTIDYYYSVRSVYAYFGSARIAELARRFGRTLRHYPIDLSQVIPAFGSVPFSERGPKVRAYYFGRELERWSAWLAMPVVIEPVHHYGDRNLPSGCVLAAQQLGLDANLLSDVILRALWRDDRDIANEAVLRSLAIECRMEPEPVLELALSADIQRQFKACTARAIEFGVPGSPTYCVDGQLFYGQDRLMFVEHQLKQGFGQDHRNVAGA
jgi:2-hydroxychromene-2-carboxylate isomerase